MFFSYKIIPSVHINFNITKNANHKIGKIGAKPHFMCRKCTYCTHFNYQTININSQDPYLLGFNSNLIPNFNILVFQPYPGEDSEYLEESGRFACISVSPLGNTPNIQEIHFDWSYFFTGYSRVHCKHRIQ